MDTKRIRRAMEWFYSTVFQDEAIQPAPAAPKNPLPPLLRAARSLASQAPNFRQPREVIFLKQATLLANYEDNYVHSSSVLHYYPTYESLSDSELRGYFSWRTRLRQGDVQKTHLTYAYLYIYELLNQIGVESPNDGYRKLVSFRQSYGALDRRILPYLQQWTQDYVIYYGLDPALLADSPQVRFDQNLAVLANLDRYTPSQITAAACALSTRGLSNSRFYKAHPAEMEQVVARVLRGMAEHYQKRSKKTLVEQYFGQFCPVPVGLFESAVFCDRRKDRSRTYILDDACTYRFENGVWFVSRYQCNGKPSPKLGALLKTIDAILRQCWDDPHPIQPELDTKWIVALITAEAQASRPKPQPKPKITIDYAQLKKIRQDAAVTREKLLVDEEREEPKAPMDEERAEPAPVEPAPASPLKPEEYRLLQSLLYGGSLSWVQAEGHLMSVLTDHINEALFDQFSDSVLLPEEPPVLIEDYIDDLKELVKP